MSGQSDVREKIRMSLERYIPASGYTQKEISEKLGVSKSSVTNWLKGKNTPDANLVMPICNLLNITVAQFYGEEGNDMKRGQSPVKSAPLYSSEAMQLAKDYDEKLDTWGRKQVRSTADIEIARCEDESRFLEETAPPAEEEPKVIPLYRVPAAAGYASPIYGSDFDYYTLKPEDPQGAMFAIRVQGDSMEPHFPDGSIAFCNKDPLQDGDIGVFCLDGDSFIKQYHYDKFMGMTYLFSLNRDRADADKLITRTGGQTLTCFGRVMTKRRFPVPM